MRVAIVSEVEEWLSLHGIELDTIQRSPAGDWLSISVPVETAERMLDTKYSVFHNPSSDSYVVRTTSYSLPRPVYQHIGVVVPTTYFGTMRRMKATSFLQPDRETISKEDAIAQLLCLTILRVPGLASKRSLSIDNKTTDAPEKRGAMIRAI